MCKGLCQGHSSSYATLVEESEEKVTSCVWPYDSASHPSSTNWIHPICKFPVYQH